MTYVLSDIHGHLRRFRSVLEQIRPGPEDVLYVLGDVIDRHPDGIRLLTALMASPCVRMIPGNHEDMMLNALDGGYDLGRREDMRARAHALALWYANGGEETHRAVARLGEGTRKRIFAFLRSLPLHLDVEAGGIRYRMVHAAPEEMAPAEMDARQFALWQRVLPEDPLPGDVTVIFGHTPTIHYQESTPLRIWYGNRRIAVDCGSGYPEITPVCGRLACLRLEDMKEFYSEM